MDHIYHPGRQKEAFLLPFQHPERQKELKPVQNQAEREAKGGQNQYKTKEKGRQKEAKNLLESPIKPNPPVKQVKGGVLASFLAQQ